MADAYWNNVVWSLSMDYATAPGIPLDASNCRRSTVPWGNVVRSNAAAKYGSFSLSKPSSAGGALVGVCNDNAFIFGTADFTLECWVYRQASGAYQALISQWSNAFDAGWSLHLTNTNTLALLMKSGSTDYATGSAGTVALNQWVHVAASRSGDTLRLFINGVQDGSRTGLAAVSYGRSTNTAIGCAVSNIDNFTGYIDEVRITNGVARYTSGFTPAQMELPDLTLGQRLAPPISRTRDRLFGGTGRITGQVKALTSPVARRVRLHSQRSGMCLGETWSDASGNYAFNYLDRAELVYVVGFDHTATYGAVIADNLTPDAMP